MNSLWIGNLAPYMDEYFLMRAFAEAAHPLAGVKIIKDKVSKNPLGYGFVEFPSKEKAMECLHKLNGKPVPNSYPVLMFKLNYSTYGNSMNHSHGYTLFLGDLSPEVDDGMLFDYFSPRYPSFSAAKVSTDASGQSRGFGFLKFGDEADMTKALQEQQGAWGLGQNPIRISLSIPRSQYQDSSMGKSPRSYAGLESNSQFQVPFETTDGHPSSGNNKISSKGDRPTNISQLNYTYTQSTLQEYDADDCTLEDHNAILDVEAANRELMEHSEELFDSLMSCHWQPLDFAPSKRTAPGLDT
ncbi:tRNA selenocysteine 1-associated protein 1-like isoform X1 [Petromyzon marinus]|uniref:tRNA selenocysteine 1-associated protein 1 n=2 Tax=Petromyzon marinus TaxID=7757 RepID=A0AAJ7U509_PETMA|nr:tRNA selenocysteine 1-associated protein 1-like isoform X1 [Petromyzon marinus]